MKYFSPDFLLFLKQIEANNHKEWFDANKERFKASVERPFEAFVNDLIDTIEPLLPDLQVSARDCIFRIYKDTRFSRDKTPYKTHISAMISRNGKKNKTTPGLYIQLSAQDIRLYSGCFELSSAQAEKIRRHILKNKDEFHFLVKEDSFKTTFGEIRGEKYKRVSAPYSDLVDQQALILNKSFYYFKKYSPEMALKENLLDLLVSDFSSCRLLNTFFLDALEIE